MASTDDDVEVEVKVAEITQDSSRYEVRTRGCFVLLVALTAGTVERRRTALAQAPRRRSVLAGGVTTASAWLPLSAVTEWFTARTPVTRPTVPAVRPTSSAV